MKEEIERYVKDQLIPELRIIQNSNRGKYDLPLSSYERAIIYKYTDDGYESLNESLREEKGLTNFGQYVNFSLSILPDYEGLCYRSIKCSKKSLHIYYDALNSGSTIIEKTFLSCSRSKALALYFSDSPLFIIKSKKGKNIEKIAKFGIDDISGQNEKEILFRCNSKFKVLDIKEKNKKITIILEEV